MYVEPATLILVVMAVVLTVCVVLAACRTTVVPASVLHQIVSPPSLTQQCSCPRWAGCDHEMEFRTNCAAVQENNRVIGSVWQCKKCKAYHWQNYDWANPKERQ